MKIEDSSKDDYYNNKVQNTSDNLSGFMEQVGKTYMGEVIPKSEFKILIHSIIDALSITKKDLLLDLGCANGLISYEISKYAKEVVGFDINQELLKVANKNHKSENILYIQKNILDIDFNQYKASKYYMYAILQYINYKDFREMLQQIKKQKKSFQLFIGDIPDQEKQLDFYHTKERQKYLFNELIENKKVHLGFWWYKQHIIQICEDLSLNVKIIDQPSSLITSHYRFDVIISK